MDYAYDFQRFGLVVDPDDLVPHFFLETNPYTIEIFHFLKNFPFFLIIGF